jgi:glutamate synthase domain-containing protein 2/glutamate synthase domain-containing protein 1/glutamate synthase domain-containing protein 3
MSALNQTILDQTQHCAGSLYDPANEHDACGVGFVAKVDGTRSNKILRMGLESLCRLVHRGALDADAKTGDGAGVTTQIPHKIFRAEVEKLGAKLYNNDDLGVGVMFLPRDRYKYERAKQITEDVVTKRGLHFFGWREVPTTDSYLGHKAASTLPKIEHVLVARTGDLDGDEYERTLFLCRNEIEKLATEDGIKGFYVPSFSSRTISYKGLFVSPSLEKFYPDLQSPDYETSICLYHQRYSTNTFPTWPLAQPFRMLCHNGEINTRRGNVNWMRAREAELQAGFWGEDIKLLHPIIQPGGSDSAELDNALEVLVMSGRSILHAMTMLVPPAWRNDKTTSVEQKEFFHYHGCINEPWDGPAALCFTDGKAVGACLDRNGLRPARYKLTDDGVLVLGSEVGTLELDDARIVEKGRLAPGEMIAIENGKLLRDVEIKKALAAQQPYAQWVKENSVFLAEVDKAPITEPAEPVDILGLTQKQIAFGYTNEELDLIVKPMALAGAEAVGSMGDDSPLAVLSPNPRVLYTYFKQLFAQVTNPPIDPIREKLVMSLNTTMGWRRNLLSETPDHAKLVHSPSPIFLEKELAALKTLESRGFKAATIQCTWAMAEGEAGLEKAVTRICQETEAAVDAGAQLIILSDRAVDHDHVAVPMLLAIGGTHHHLIRAGKRMKASLIADSGEPRDVHHVALLIGYGASGVCPHVLWESMREVIERNRVAAQQAVVKAGEDEQKRIKAEEALKAIPDYTTALKNTRKALEDGLLKIMSKMGISVIASYRGAQIFEAIGVGTEVVRRCFDGTASQIGGIGFIEIARESLTRHAQGFAAPVPTEQVLKREDGGFYRYRPKAEIHAVTPPVIQNFHTFVKTGDPAKYKSYVEALRGNHPITIKDLLEFVPKAPVPIEEVESAEDIRRRFTTAGMSLGALSREAHEALAIAMNRIGGKSNSGEGGEDPERFKVLPNGDSANSAIKQIASGRFGVTAAYLASAKEIEIKMAQGAKPGEGGQLPGHKVSAYIAQLRNTVPGVMLISPPPHHDIYSIEDLAQLIHDLKEVNPRAKVTVKLVAEAGVGTVAAGVAKAHADVVLVSGHDGGTGASPLSSVKYAGAPWELGVAETQQVLMANDLRSRIVLRTDGGMRTGEDIVKAAILGAEEFNFGTTALIALGCVYVRQCHLNTCPVGIATQDEKLRSKFKGSPEMVVNFFNGVAEEVRQIMASLGIRKMTDLIGHTEFLRQRKVEGHAKANTLDLSPLLKVCAKSDQEPRHCTSSRNDGTHDAPIDDTILQDAKDAITEGRKMTLRYKVRNTNRNVGTKVSGEIGYQYGREGLPEGTLTLELSGSAGQSFGTFLAPGLRLVLTGEANDYVGKGMSGGEIVVRPPAKAKFAAHENSIVGNTCLYGATRGHLFANGRAGERFGVRNSGAVAVVEGAGDHCCEYMTGGVIVVLGNVGKNMGAGMTGGVAYVLDQDGLLPELYNSALVVHEALSEEDAVTVKQLVYQHLDKTESARAREILADWPKFEAKFLKIRPRSAAPKMAGLVQMPAAMPASKI